MMISVWAHDGSTAAMSAPSTAASISSQEASTNGRHVPHDELLMRDAAERLSRGRMGCVSNLRGPGVKTLGRCLCTNALHKCPHKWCTNALMLCAHTQGSPIGGTPCVHLCERHLFI
jgi:hypothetical protein